MSDMNPYSILDEPHHSHYDEAVRRRSTEYRKGTRVRVLANGEVGRIVSWVKWDRDYFRVALDRGGEATFERGDIECEDGRR